MRWYNYYITLSELSTKMLFFRTNWKDSKLHEDHSCRKNNIYMSNVVNCKSLHTFFQTSFLLERAPFLGKSVDKLSVDIFISKKECNSSLQKHFTLWQIMLSFLRFYESKFGERNKTSHIVNHEKISTTVIFLRKLIGLQFKQSRDILPVLMIH